MIATVVYTVVAGIMPMLTAIMMIMAMITQVGGRCRTLNATPTGTSTAVVDGN